MYAGSTVEDDILTEKNYSLTNPLFPRAIVDVFHERIEKALGNPDMGALNLKYPIYPTCEQPMLDEFEGGCVPSDSKYRIAIFYIMMRKFVLWSFLTSEKIRKSKTSSQIILQGGIRESKIFS